MTNTYWVIQSTDENGDKFYVGVEYLMNARTGDINPGHWRDINKAFAFETHDGADTFIRGYLYRNSCKAILITRETKEIEND